MVTSKKLWTIYQQEFVVIYYVYDGDKCADSIEAIVGNKIPVYTQLKEDL